MSSPSQVTSAVPEIVVTEKELVVKETVAADVPQEVDSGIATAVESEPSSPSSASPEPAVESKTTYASPEPKEEPPEEPAAEKETTPVQKDSRRAQLVQSVQDVWARLHAYAAQMFPSKSSASSEAAPEAVQVVVVGDKTDEQEQDQKLSSPPSPIKRVRDLASRLRIRLRRPSSEEGASKTQEQPTCAFEEQVPESTGSLGRKQTFRRVFGPNRRPPVNSVVIPAESPASSTAASVEVSAASASGLSPLVEQEEPAEKEQVVKQEEQA